MREVLDQLLTWWRSGQTVGLATVVDTWQSAPRAPGAVMLVGPDGSVVGSVSGGCVEADVHAVAETVVADGVPQLRRYGVSDADATAVGLPCGGTLDVLIEAVSLDSFPGLAALAADVTAGRPVAVATVLEHPDAARVGRRLVVTEVGSEGTLGGERIDAAVTDDVRGLLAAGHSRSLTYGPDGERRGTGLRVFAAVLAPRPRMLVFGASDFAAAVARMGGFLGYRVTVCDARPLFTTDARFPDADEVVVAWPHTYLAAEAAAGRTDERTVVCVLTHDPKFDGPLLEVALRLPLGYVGAMGSRRTHDERQDRLRTAGLTDAELARLASPIGLDLGARTPEETAVSIAAEIVRTRWGGEGRPLRELGGRIHHDPR
ncbi:XdhC family protein [uncultured Friedmanniella sp.]|uniref:XdhC family protein n=1 Tax=uncultured Friedmanniella sp. TaxID=335381 RepID=UPI0035CB4713